VKDPGPEDLATVLRAVPPDGKIFGYFADMRPIKPMTVDGKTYGGFLLFVFECPIGKQGKAYGT
jgi:hypothetical protein